MRCDERRIQNMSLWVPGRFSLSGGANIEPVADTNGNQTYQELLKGIRDILRESKRTQKPQLSSSHKLV